MTKQELMIYAAIKKYEIIYQESELLNIYIGLRKKNSGVYYWFKQYEHSDRVYFDHRYSQNNGKISKSFKVGYNFTEKLLK